MQPTNMKEDSVSSGHESTEEHVEQEQGEDNGVIAQNETKAVRFSKLVVLLVLGCSALGVALCTFFYVDGSESTQFENKFRDDAAKIFDSIGSSLDRTLAMFDSLAVVAVSSARVANQTWPFVTMADFGIRLAKIYPLSHAVSINILPLVTPDQRLEWEAYSIANDWWVNESMKLQEKWSGYYGPVVYEWEPNKAIFGDWGDIPYNETSRLFVPQWQSFPAVPSSYAPYNWDWASVSNPDSLISCMTNRQAVVSDAYMIPTPNDPVAQAETEAWIPWFESYIHEDEEPVEPVSNIYYPIVDDLRQVELDRGELMDAPVVGVIAADFYWREWLRNTLPDDSQGIDVIVENPCTEAFSYRIYGPKAKYLGVTDLHEARYEHLGVSKSLLDVSANSSHAKEYTGLPLDQTYCQFTLHIYPSAELEAFHSTNNRVIFTICAVAIFAFTSLVFFFYDFTVERRQTIVMTTAVRSSAIVSSLFPEDVRHQMYHTGQHVRSKKTNARALVGGPHESEALMGGVDFSSSPIANLYENTTVLFADIVGFTSWSSQRQPTQVFRLLETVYYSFDVIAKQRGVFKVETIGDSYVAVVGLPNPREHHALIMARFARDIRRKMAETVLELDTALGPGTADLALRIGLNSGPTTAGVLRGEKSRFQLFGDTVNTAARMESNGAPNKIHVSQSTADLIQAAGKGHWLTHRTEKVNAKGKGMMQTFFCEPSLSADGASVSSQTSADCDECHDKAGDGALTGEQARLVDWHVDLFSKVIGDIVRCRGTLGSTHEIVHQGVPTMPRDEVAQVAVVQIYPPNSIQADNVSMDMLSPNVKEQLHDLITTIAQLYNEAKFHDFAHCSHVVMSTKRLLSHIAAQEPLSHVDVLTCQALNDPSMQFAIMFAALIHDIDHPGVSNAQQVKESTEPSLVYHGKSVAEQNSIVVAWNVLMKPCYKDLQAALFGCVAELNRFRQIVVNGVMATDLFDNGLKAGRDNHWQKSMWEQEAPSSVHEVEDLASHRATCLINLIVQAADVSHTMQHFSVYQKWNQRLLAEMMSAYQCGRGEKDPLEGWYNGELGFFDNYVIPLAKKLKFCRMFGSLSHELLGYAHDNRMEWETIGRSIVAEMTTDVERVEV